MILAKAPMRVSFFGGGSDIASHYTRWGGSTLSMAIDKYVYVAVGHTPHDHIKVSYAKQETVKHVSDIQNEIVRNALTYFNIRSNIEINSFANIPTMGTGLGGSSSFTCALVAALMKYTGRTNIDSYEIAETACHIEIELCKWNIGKQDQYASAFGGMNYIKYYPDTRIKVQKIDSNGIDHNMILVPTNITRHASEILDRIDMHDKSSLLMELSKQADFYAEHYPEIISYSTALNEAWKMKKALEKNISNPEIDEMYDRCIQAGALGAKLLGAGGGGFFPGSQGRPEAAPPDPPAALRHEDRTSRALESSVFHPSS